ncbi:MAG: DUF6519 domain-containing protein [Planctomycetota bacterium]|jgi:hypothetical protein
MKGDFSQLTFEKVKNYNSVLKQQGRVSLDADANELIEILAHQRRVRTVDVIGTCCAPINAGGFKIRHPGGNPQDLLISTGRIYVGGLLCELHPCTKIPVTFPDGQTNRVQVKELKIDEQAVSKNQWVVIFTKEDPEGILAQINAINTTSNILTLSKDISSLKSGTAPQLQQMILYSEQPDYPDAKNHLPTAGNTYLVYLDVWERHITAIEDPDLREVALGGPDTTTRIQTISQVKLFRVQRDVECGDEIPAWKEEIAPSGGRLTATTIPGTEPEDPCLIAEGGGYRGLENRLYRVEIHVGGDIGTAEFKWSRDNGSIAYEIQEFIEEPPGQVRQVQLKQIGRDEILKIKQNDWLEISGDETDLNVKNAGTIAQVTNIDEAQLILTLSVDVTTHRDENHTKVRRWDTGIDTPTPPTTTAAGPIELEDGIQIEFSGKNLKVGDYWIFAARTSTGEIEVLENEPPRGIKHYYCKLALVTFNLNRGVEIKDCRHEFPSLCDLPKGGKGCCTVTVGEGGDFDNIQEAVNALEGGPGTVCILPGIYQIDEPISVQGRDITIKGCGGASLILNLADSRESGAIFRIQDSWGITINDLWCVTLKGDRAIVSVNSQFVEINDCLVVAAGFSDNPGAVVFRGLSLGSELKDNIIAGIVGVRYEAVPGGESKIHAASRIENNAIFAFQNAIYQSRNAPLFIFNVVDNLLLGFGINSLAKSYFPATFLRFAEKNAVYSPSAINEAKAARKKEEAFESATHTDVTPVLNFVNHLKVEAATAKIKGEGILAAEVATAEPVVNLLQGAIDANFQNNAILGKTGIRGALLMESSIERNIVGVLETGILLESFEGVTIDDNILSAGGSGIQCRGPISFNLTASNNRFLSGTHGIEFQAPEEDAFHLAINIQICQNFVSVSDIGIMMRDERIWIYDLSAVDNSFYGCKQVGILLVGQDQFMPEGVVGFQRVIQRNSFVVKGTGIATALADTNILDNNITISYQPANQTDDNSYGIIIAAENCTAANNTIEGVVNRNQKIFSKGGILIGNPFFRRGGLCENVVVRCNRISGGTGNGVEIVSGSQWNCC